MHIVQRGVDRQACFFGDADRRLYLDLLETSALRHRCRIHAYVLMTNHVHLLLTPDDAEGPSRLLQSLGRHYVRHVNDAYDRTGTLWEGRFRSCLVGEAAYLLACHRYIELNPVRAGMVGRPDAYAWSSHRANAWGEASTLLTPHAVFLELGATAVERRLAYREVFENATSDAAALAALRRCTRSNYAYGSPRFEIQVAALLGRRAAPGRPGRPRNAAKWETAH